MSPLSEPETMNNKTERPQSIYGKRTITTFIIIYLLGVSGGLFLYPFLGYQGIIAFTLLGLSIVMLIGAMAIRD